MEATNGMARSEECLETQGGGGRGGAAAAGGDSKNEVRVWKHG